MSGAKGLGAPAQNGNTARDEYSVFTVLRRCMAILFRSAPLCAAADCSLAIVHSLFFTASVIATQGLFDAISGAASGNLGFWDCLIPLLILAGITFGQQIMNGVHNFNAMAVAHPILKGRVMTILHKKLQRVDPASFEDTSFLDDLNKAREGANSMIFFCMIILMLLFFYGLYFMTIGAYLYSLKPILLYTLLLAFIPALLSQAVRAKVFTKLEEQNAPLRREYEYYQKTICDREYFKETRILGAFSFLHRLFSETMALLTRKNWQAERKTSLLQLLLNTASFAGMAAASYMLFTATMAGEITVGAFAAVFSALGAIFNIMNEIINWHIGNMNRDIGKIKNFIRMLDMPERKRAAGAPDFSKGVAAENVRFTYPGRDEPALDGVSLSLADGETIAIVGENGAGKSTFVRLLTGIYQPSAGTVTIGGLVNGDPAEQTAGGGVPAAAQTAGGNVPTSPPVAAARAQKNEFFRNSIHTGISGVFQKYQRYKMTLGENVAISDTGGTDEIPGKNPAVSDMGSNRREGVSADESRVNAALREAGTEIGAGLDDMLSPEFDGVDLSGGQWQRLAIARGLYRPSGFIVLDEPTSAIDPIEETRIYTQFQKLAEGKCAIIVTHRLGSAKLAHRIAVMDAGKIVDMGTHDELVSRPGKYADMWAAQAQWYERG